jgi:hypothetical protein
MSGPMRLFVGSYPEFYDPLLVPVLFAPYARIPAERLRSMTVGNVLEIAAGKQGKKIEPIEARNARGVASINTPGLLMYSMSRRRL